jgi:bifunctional UDP-N-acetylglucosamine pyrophosphorylase / glucosamine-1-phosphate N-acetyltransferase
MPMKAIGVILAGGKGTRFKSEGENKTTFKLHGKPLVMYGVELLKNVTEKIVVVVGAYAQSVKETIGNRPGVIYATQEEPLGTGHAVITAVKELVARGENPEMLVVGYADHMMFYKPEMVSDMLRIGKDLQAKIVLATSEYDQPNELRWGRIIRNNSGEVARIVEQKDATEEEREVCEVNPGFYCFDFKFLVDNRDNLKKSPVSGEYYITDFIQLAVDQGLKVVPYPVSFSDVGLGVNTREELAEDENIKNQNL